ncbi:MAG: helix-hairpin-helix domain-containing protein [Chitinispirillaceae bacterium]|nr:helix-hairpin-helix domain-containing protein [Chitinispirillaceae bacterium]
MDTHQKLELLSDASRFDLACACGTNEGDRRKRGNDGTWLYPISLPRGGYSVILKTLISNVCVNDCGYCPYRSTMDVPRCTIDPGSMARLFLEYVRIKKVFGLFLSSGVAGSPDHSMTLLNDTAAILRKRYKYRGYIHLKVLPGATDAAVEESLSLANTVSLNIETPGKHHIRKLSSKKDFENDIIQPLKMISRMTGKGMRYERVKTTTQFIVGASDETDREIVTYTLGLYKRLHVQRVYFSAYQRGNGDAAIPGETARVRREDGSFMREHRIYQADFLFRKYGFQLNDFIFDNHGDFFLDKDPKQVWAERHGEFFPVRINAASKDALLRVPGIGPITARTILKQRKQGRVCTWEQIGVSGRALEKIKRYAVMA